MVGSAESMKMTCGVTQGSILGPSLWNIYFDSVLSAHLSDNVLLVGYANDTALMFRGSS